MVTFKTLKQNLKKDVSDLPVLKVVLLGDTATQFFGNRAERYCDRKGYDLNLFETEYNQMEIWESYKSRRITIENILICNTGNTHGAAYTKTRFR
jgi:hypothetical protein